MGAGGHQEARRMRSVSGWVRRRPRVLGKRGGRRRRLLDSEGRRRTAREREGGLGVAPGGCQLMA